jgi:hypothetical protein
MPASTVDGKKSWRSYLRNSMQLEAKCPITSQKLDALQEKVSLPSFPSNGSDTPRYKILEAWLTEGIARGVLTPRQKNLAFRHLLDHY